MALQVYALHFLVRHLAACRILAPIQATGHLEPRRPGRLGYQIHDRLIVAQRLTAPVRGDKGEQPVLDLVPLARARRKVADGDGKTRLVRQHLQFQLPKPQARPVAAPAVRSDQQVLGRRIEAPALIPPPALDGRHGETLGVLIRPQVYESCVAPQVIDAAGERAGNIGPGKVVPLHLDGPLLWQPLLSPVPHQLLLLGIHGDHWHALRQGPLDLHVDVPELRVPVWMVFALLRLAVALQAVAQIVKELGNLRVADRMLLPVKLRGQGPRALTGPAQRRLRIDQTFHRALQPGIVLGDLSTSRSRLPHPARRGSRSGLDLLDALGNGLARQAARPAHPRNPAAPQGTGLVGGQQPTCPLVQKRPHAGQLLLKFRGRLHTSQSYTLPISFATFIYLRYPSSSLGFEPSVTGVFRYSKRRCALTFSENPRASKNCGRRQAESPESPVLKRPPSDVGSDPPVHPGRHLHG